MYLPYNVMDKQSIRRNYNQFARWYDTIEMIPEWLGVRRLRRKLLKRASGQVLEVACGTGLNFKSYPPDTKLLAIDLSEEMLKLAQGKARSLDLNVNFALMDGERLALQDRSFDTVISSLSLCTFPNPKAALFEMARVCKPDGRIFLLEHGRSNYKWLGRWQDYRAERHAKAFGCWWNREPLELVRQANLSLTGTNRIFFGILHLIEAKPV